MCIGRGFNVPTLQYKYLAKVLLQACFSLDKPLKPMYLHQRRRQVQLGKYTRP